MTEMLELYSPVTREDVEANADELLSADLEGDARERAIDDIVRAARQHDSWIDSRDPAEQAVLRARPIITGVAPDESGDNSGGDKPKPVTRKRRGR